MIQGSNTAWDLPGLLAGGLVCLGAGLAGLTDRLANSAPIASSKKPLVVPAAQYNVQHQSVQC